MSNKLLKVLRDAHRNNEKSSAELQEFYAENGLNTPEYHHLVDDYIQSLDMTLDGEPIFVLDEFYRSDEDDLVGLVLQYGDGIIFVPCEFNSWDGPLWDDGSLPFEVEQYTVTINRYRIKK